MRLVDSPVRQVMPRVSLFLIVLLALPQSALDSINLAEKHPNSRSLMFGLKYELLYA